MEGTADDKTWSRIWSETPGKGQRILILWAEGHASATLQPNRPVIVGRSKSAHVRVDHPSISRHHARITGGDPLTIEDLGSLNGTQIGGNTIPSNTPLPIPADELIQIGSAVVVVGGVNNGAATEESTTARSFANEPIRTTEPAPAPAPPGQTPMEQLGRLMDTVAASNISVILLGETGVGKEVMAERLHQLSPRADAPLIRLNCAALHDTLLESELFGHEKGAFTGAVSAKQGLLEAANGGTVFFDELGEMPLTTQAKLLRAIEAREVQRLGSVKTRPINVRFVAATNRRLDEAIAANQFRRDLYFRLAGITLVIPPLRERTDEIFGLAATFVREFSESAGRTPPVFSPAAMQRLSAYQWPGNVRELRNVVQRALLFTKGNSIHPDDLVLDAFGLDIPQAGPPHQTARPPAAVSTTYPAKPAPPPRNTAPPPTSADPLGAHSPSTEGAGLPHSSGDLRGELEKHERDRILDALREAQGNQTRAAGLLGISRRTLVNRLDHYHLPRPRKGLSKTP